MSAPTFPAPNAPRNPRATQAPAVSRGARRGRFAVDIHRHRLLDLQHSDDLPQQRGVAGGRYHCPACQGLLAFSGRRACAQYTPRFTHRYVHGRHHCPAHTLHLQAIRAGQNLSTALRESLTAAHPQLVHYLEPGDLGYPPALVLRDGARTTVIHPQLTAPSQGSARSRIQDCYRRHGAKTAQLWLLPWQPPDTATPARTGSMLDRARAGVVVVPSPMHRTVCLQGATVGFLDGDHLWLPRTAGGPAVSQLAEAPLWSLVRVPLTSLTLHTSGVIAPDASRPAADARATDSKECGHQPNDAPPLPLPIPHAPTYAAAPAVSRTRQALRRIAFRARSLASQLIDSGVRGWQRWRLYLDRY